MLIDDEHDDEIDTPMGTPRSRPSTQATKGESESSFGSYELSQIKWISGSSLP